MKKTLLVIACFVMGLLGTTSNVSADIIFDADTTNTTLVSNTTGTIGTLSGTAGNLTYENSPTSFNFSGFTSTDDINTLNGTPITDLDTVTITLVVQEFNNAQLRSNGIDFGINNTTSSPPSNTNPGDLIGRTEATNGSDIVTFFNGATTDSGFNATVPELTNGFTTTLVADVNGYTFTFDSVGTTSPVIVTGDFTGTQFVDIVGGGHFSYTQQQRLIDANPGNLTSTILEASIQVTTAVPEPSSLALLAVGAVGFCVRRRR